MTTNPLSPFVFDCHAITHPGKKRKINEDACISRDNILLWAVADGMGGHSAGDVASHNVVTSLNQVTPPSSLHAFVDDIETQLIDCSKKLRELSINELDNRTVGSTVALLLIYENYCAYMWVGDSRIYRLRSGKLCQLGRDHSRVEELITAGLLLRENAEEHPEANVITRAIGAGDELFIDINIDEVLDNDTYLICSDGLNKHITFHGIESEMAQGSAIDICTRLINSTLEAGAEDNVTVSVIKVRKK